MFIIAAANTRYARVQIKYVRENRRHEMGGGWRKWGDGSGRGGGDSENRKTPTKTLIINVHVFSFLPQALAQLAPKQIRKCAYHYVAVPTRSEYQIFISRRQPVTNIIWLYNLFHHNVVLQILGDWKCLCDILKSVGERCHQYFCKRFFFSVEWLISR